MSRLDWVWLEALQSLSVPKPLFCCSYCCATITAAAERKQTLQFRYLGYRYSTAQLHQSYANILPNSKRIGSEEEDMQKVVMAHSKCDCLEDSLYHVGPLSPVRNSACILRTFISGNNDCEYGLMSFEDVEALNFSGIGKVQQGVQRKGSFPSLHAEGDRYKMKEIGKVSNQS